MSLSCKYSSLDHLGLTMNVSFGLFWNVWLQALMNNITKSNMSF